MHTQVHIEKCPVDRWDKQFSGNAFPLNWFEREVSKWVPMFYFKMSSLCIRKPRFSEMRPIRYNV